MPTYNPKQLGEPEVIREINPTVLCAFLKPFEGYLRPRGLEVKEPSRFDNAASEKLVEILTNPSMKTPQALLNAVFYVEEMLTLMADVCGSWVTCRWSFSRDQFTYRFTLRAI